MYNIDDHLDRCPICQSALAGHMLTGDKSYELNVYCTDCTLYGYFLSCNATVFTVNNQAFNEYPCELIEQLTKQRIETNQSNWKEDGF